MKTEKYITKNYKQKKNCITKYSVVVEWRFYTQYPFEIYIYIFDNIKSIKIFKCQCILHATELPKISGVTDQTLTEQKKK